MLGRVLINLLKASKLTILDFDTTIWEESGGKECNVMSVKGEDELYCIHVMIFLLFLLLLFEVNAYI